MHNVTVFFPRTAYMKAMTLELDDSSKIEEAEPCKIVKPIVYYGSSITMGASSKSPSKAYTALVSERLCADHINLGFGGNAKGELNMARYISSLEMSAFVFDYEHNADTIEYLKSTHKPFFDEFRKAQPNTPVMFISRPDTDREYLRSVQGRRVVMDTFYSAIDSGDMNVDFIDGFYLLGNEGRDDCSVDDCHPNEKGFARMADVIYPRLKALIEGTRIM